MTLDQTFNPALSGNIFKRKKWLKQNKNGLAFVNWGHVERSLEIQSQERSRFVKIPRHLASIYVEQSDAGWWNQDDHTFLLNTVLFRSILSHYHSNAHLQRYALPFKPNAVSATVLKAILYSRTIETGAPKETIELVRSCLVTNKLSYSCYRLIYAMPKPLVRVLRKILRAIYYTATVR